jgi:flavin-dependent dehydrogenase
MANCRNCDVVVVGGGPAGSTIASLLAQKRRHVVVLEKERFPRFHVGESLLPLNLPIFDRLGVADDVQRIGIYKPGAELISNAHGAATTFHFADNPYLSVGYSYHVRRADFDKLLLDNCRRLGAEVREGTRVTDVAIDSHPCVTAVGPDGVPTRWLSRFLVDASGRDTLLANRLKLKQIDKRNNTAAVFGHFRNVPHLSGDRAGMISVHLFQHGWFWVIPLPDDITSVGVVGRRAMFKARDTSLDVLFARAVAACPSLAKQMAVAEPTGPLLACADYSYNSQSYVGENHILIGDAAAFIDPLFSSGVMMAMSSAIFGELVVNACLDGRPSRAQLARDYQHKIRLSLDSLSWLIFRINDPILRDLLMSSADLLNTRQQLIKILAGNFYTRHSLLSPLRRVQLAYGCLVLLSKFGFYLGQEGTVGRARSDTRTRA